VTFDPEATEKRRLHCPPRSIFVSVTEWRRRKRFQFFRFICSRAKKEEEEER